MPRPVKTKADFYRRFQNGEFGNSSPQWGSLEEYIKSGYTGLIAVRTRTPGGRCDYFIPPEKVVSTVNSFLSQGYSPQDLHFSAQCPEEDKLLQGETQRTQYGLYLFGSTNADLPMREALKRDSFQLFGLEAHLMSKNRMCPSSWEWLNYLLDAYEDHVVEFTTIKYPWGTIPGYNTIFWEVRAY